MKVAENIKKFRKESRLTQKQLAEKVGIAEITIRQYEAGKYIPKVETLYKLAMALNCEVSDIDESLFNIMEKQSDGMITISEQVKHLKELSDTARANMYLFEALSQSLREAADTIESLSAKLQAANEKRSAEDCGGWITDKEPEESGYYLVTYHEWSNGNYLPKFDDTYVKRLHYQKSELFTGWNYPKCVDEKSEEDMNMEVMAWQPLPEPYHEP